MSIANHRNDPSLAASELALRIEEAALATGFKLHSILLDVSCMQNGRTAVVTVPTQDTECNFMP